MISNKRKDILRLTEILATAKDQSEEGHDRIDRYRRYYRDNVAEISKPKKTGHEPIKSRYRSRAIKKLFRKKISLLTESVLTDDFLFTSSGWNLGYTKEDRLLNYQWNIQVDRHSIVNKSAKNLVIDGTAIIKTEWATEDLEKIIEVEVPVIARSVEEVIRAYPDEPSAIEAFQQGKAVQIGTTIKKDKQTVIVSSKPVINVVEPSNIYFGNNGSIIEKIRMSYLDIISNASIDVKESVLKEAFTKSENYNIDNMWMSDQEGDGSYSSISVEYFASTYRDLALKEIDVYQYWGKFSDDSDSVEIEKEMVIVWAGETILSKIENPYQHKKPPYSVSNYETFDNSKFGESESEVLHHDQTAVTTISRVLHSLVLNTHAGQTLYRDGLFTPQEERNYLNGKSAIFNKSHDLKDSIVSASIPTIDNGSYDLIGMFTQPFDESDIVDGSSSVDQNGKGIPSTVNDSALLRTYLDLLTSVAGFINSMNIQLNANETSIVDAIGTTVIPEGYLQNINRDIKFVAGARTPHEKAEMSMSIEKLMATSGGNMDEKISLAHYIELALINNNYALAKELSLTLDNLKNPPPDPMQEIMIEREKLENERIKAEINRLKSQSNENDARAMERLNKIEEMTARSETMLNEAKATLAQAQVEKSRAETDFFRNELEYVVSGRKQRDDEIRDEFKHGARLESESVRTDRELKLNQMKADQAKELKGKEVDVTKEKSDNPETFLQAFQRVRTLKNKEMNTVGNARTSVMNGNYADKEEELQYNGEAIKPN